MYHRNNGFVVRDFEIKGHRASFRRNILIYTVKLHRCAICGCRLENCPCLDLGVLEHPDMLEV